MKVLYLEDDAQDAHLVRIELGKRAPEIHLDIVSTLAEALARLERFHSDNADSPMRTAATQPIASANAEIQLVMIWFLPTSIFLMEAVKPCLPRFAPSICRCRSLFSPAPVARNCYWPCSARAPMIMSSKESYLETLPLVLRAALDKFHRETFWRAAALKVIFVDPNTHDVDLTKRELVALAPHLHIESLQTAEQVFDRFSISGSRPDTDVLLLDYRLPGASATDILKELCQVRGLDVPIVLVIGPGDEEIARQSFKLGAADYVVKSPGYIQRLPTVIENVWLRAESNRRERVLREERTRLSLATEAAAIGIWEWNIATNEIIWDDRMYDIHGVPRGSAITYETWKSYIHPDDLTEKEAQLNKIREENGSSQFDFRIQQRHEHVRHVHIAKTVKFGEKNELTIVGAAIDITERKQSELAIQQHAMQQGLIAAFGQKALASADLDELWHEATVIASEGLNVTFSKALLLSPDLRSFNLKAGSGWQEGWVGRCISSTYENSQNRFILASHQPVIIGDFCTESRFKPSKILKSHLIRSAAGVVISGAGGPYGVLGAYARDPYRFSASSTDFLRSLANILATAIDRKKTEERLTYLAQFDPLTGLPNRNLFLDRLEQAMEHAQRNQGRIAVVFADLDRFKIVNDTMGHGTGDRLLVQGRATAAAMRPFLRYGRAAWWRRVWVYPVQSRPCRGRNGGGRKGDCCALAIVRAGRSGSLHFRKSRDQHFPGRRG